MPHYVLGLSAYYHDSAAAIIRDGEIIAAAQEERFTRKKHDHAFPKHAVEYCLREAGITPDQVSYVVFYDKPLLKFDRLVETYVAYAPAGLQSFMMAMPLWLKTKLFLPREIKASLGGTYKKRVAFTGHHESHAASAFFPSPFDDAAILTLDGVGEWETASIGHGRGNRIEMLKTLHFPHSLGLLYSAITYFCGFRVNSGEYKLMGLAPYGEPKYADIIRERSMLRRLISVANGIADSGYNPVGRKAAEILDEAERRVFNIADERPQDRGPIPINPLLTKAVDRIDELANSEGGLTGLGSGYTDLDKMTSGWQKSDLVIVAGRPSMGKTAFAMNLVEHAVLTNDKPVLVFSLEMPAQSLIFRMLSSIGRINQTKLRTGQLTEDDWPGFNNAVAKLKDRPLFIYDSAGLSPMEMRARARRLVREHGPLGMVVVDYLQLMQVKGTSENRVGEISEISRSLKLLAREFECPVIALSQLNRALEQRPNKRPVMSDLRESGAIEQDADVIAFIYRDEVYNEDSADKGIAEIIIGKQRNGPIGTVRLSFIGQYTRFENHAQPRYDDSYTHGL